MQAAPARRRCGDPFNGWITHGDLELILCPPSRAGDIQRAHGRPEHTCDTGPAPCDLAAWPRSERFRSIDPDFRPKSGDLGSRERASASIIAFPDSGFPGSG